jgi:hypothetical protein
MGRFQRSWQLFKASMSVISSHKELILFPIVIAMLMVVIVLFFVAPVVLMPTGYSITQAEHWQTIGHRVFVDTGETDSRGKPSLTLTPSAMAYLAFLYLATMFAATFLNVAFYNEILAALMQQPVSIVRGLKFAATRLKAILLWSLLAGVVGIIIKTLERRFGLVGRLVLRLVGVAWSIASVFAIPIIVQEEEATNPLETLKKSAAILKNTWGEALIGYVGLSAASGIVVLASLGFLCVALFASIAVNNFWIIAITGVIWFVGIVVFSYLLGLAGQVYKGALYLYAANGVVAQPYNQDMFSTAWKFKKQK